MFKVVLFIFFSPNEFFNDICQLAGVANNICPWVLVFDRDIRDGRLFLCRQRFSHRPLSFQGTENRRKKTNYHQPWNRQTPIYSIWTQKDEKLTWCNISPHKYKITLQVHTQTPCICDAEKTEKRSIVPSVCKMNVLYLCECVKTMYNNSILIEKTHTVCCSSAEKVKFEGCHI